MLEACRNGHFSIVEMLLNHDNGLLEITNDYGWTPLLSAIRYDHEHTTEIVQFLLNRGANVNANDAKVMTALMVACRERRLETMRLLLADGRCDVEARDKKYQQTALHYAADSDFFEGVRELILQHNADMLALDKYGDTPFDIATLQGSADVVECLLQLFGNKMAHDHEGHALHAILRSAEYKFHLR